MHAGSSAIRSEQGQHVGRTQWTGRDKDHYAHEACYLLQPKFLHTDYLATSSESTKLWNCIAQSPSVGGTDHDSLLPEVTSFRPFPSWQSPSTWFPAVASSSPGVAWVFQKYHVSVIFPFKIWNLRALATAHLPQERPPLPWPPKTGSSTLQTAPGSFISQSISTSIHEKWETKSTLMFNSLENTCFLISKTNTDFT